MCGWDSKSPFCCYGSCPFWNIHWQYDDCDIIHWGKFDTACLHLVSHKMNWIIPVNWINGHFIKQHTLGSIKLILFFVFFPLSTLSQILFDIQTTYHFTTWLDKTLVHILFTSTFSFKSCFKTTLLVVYNSNCRILPFFFLSYN